MNVTCRAGDVFNRILMAQTKRFHMTRMPKTKQTVGILDVLLNEGYINGYEIRGEEPRQEISVYLKYDPVDNQGVIKKLRLISKPSREVIVPIKELPPVIRAWVDGFSARTRGSYRMHKPEGSTLVASFLAKYSNWLF